MSAPILVCLAGRPGHPSVDFLLQSLQRRLRRPLIHLLLATGAQPLPPRQRFGAALCLLELPPTPARPGRSPVPHRFRPSFHQLLGRTMPVIPVWYGDSPRPTAPSIASLPGLPDAHPGIRLRPAFLSHDLDLITARLRVLRPACVHPHAWNGPFPEGRRNPGRPVPLEALRRSQETTLPDWQVLPGNPRPGQRPFAAALSRSYTFPDFGDAILFLQRVANGCEAANHHPRWENSYRRLTVHLATWDDGLDAVTGRDLALARYLDQAFVQDRA